MVYKNFTVQVIIHLIVIIALTFLTAYSVLIDQWSFFPITAIFIIIESVVLIYSFNRTNRSLAYFFESIENDDTQLRFHTKKRNQSMKRLYESMNRVNRLIAETKLQNERNEQYYKALIQQSATGLIAMNPDNSINIVNEKACELAGISMASHFSRLEKKNPELWILLCTIKSGETMTIKVFHNGIYHHLSICATVLCFSGSETKLISIQDIKHELDAKEMESWQKLISILTHEIMNSIAPITSLTTTLTKFFKRNDNPVPASEVDARVIQNTIQGLEIIGERGNGLLNFVTNYRRLTKIPQPVFIKFKAYDWLNNLKILLCEKLDENNISFEISVDKQASTLNGDEKLLTQVLINLIYNAIDALLSKSENRKIRVIVERNEQKQIQIIVSNNGPMISAELVDKLFIPFFTTKENGSGIGLSLSRQIVQLHHGYIYLESDETITRFIIVL
jgi:two-component system, NtrC family, nitrogen regulation sensor histidine kinase NtrY